MGEFLDIHEALLGRQDQPSARKVLQSKIRWLLAGTAAVLAAAAAFAIYQVAQSYILKQAEQRAREVMLESRALHWYVQRNMHPALYQAKKEARVPEDFYAPELLSSTYIARNLYAHYNEERKNLGLPEIRYKLAAVDPRNKVNEADSFERSLIETFNADPGKTEHLGFVDLDGRRYLYYATPFLRMEERCLKCHGQPEAAPQQLREYYQWQGGWNRKLGDVVAIESTMSPLQAEARATHIALGGALAIAAGVVALFFVNARLGNLVGSYTSALSQSEARYKTLVENVGMGITLIDRNYRLVMVNQEQARLLGGWSTVTLGQHCYERMGCGDGVCPDCPGVRAMATGRPAEVERNVQWQDGPPVPTRLRAFPLPGDNGQAVGFIEIAEDISERKQAEHELARYRGHLEELVEHRTKEVEAAREQVRQADRLASMGTFAAGVAHEINNPLGMMLLGTEAALGNLDKPDIVAELLRQNKDLIRRCAHISQGVLDFSRKQSTEKQPQNLNEIVGRALEFTRESGKKHEVVVQAQMAPTLGPILGNMVELTQVVVNLVQNAIQACSAGGHVTIETCEANGKIRLVVQDDGCGMDSEELRRIFDPFYTTRQAKGGTGLGLSVIHGIVTDHRGTIAVKSEPGKGTTFTLEFGSQQESEVGDGKGPRG